jgi:hypothetical protein
MPRLACSRPNDAAGKTGRHAGGSHDSGAQVQNLRDGGTLVILEMPVRLSGVVVPERHLPKFNALCNAFNEELVVVRLAGSVVGRAVGRRVYSAQMEVLPPKPRSR